MKSFSLLGTIAELRNATITFVISVCLSVSVRPPVRLSPRMNEIGSHCTDFLQI